MKNIGKNRLLAICISAFLIHLQCSTNPAAKHPISPDAARTIIRNAMNIFILDYAIQIQQSKSTSQQQDFAINITVLHSIPNIVIPAWHSKEFPGDRYYQADLERCASQLSATQLATQNALLTLLTAKQGACHHIHTIN